MSITPLQVTDDGAASLAIINDNFEELDTRRIVVYKSADETVNNSATLQNDDHLSFAIGANEVWGITLQVLFTSGATPDIKFGWSVPSGTTMSWNVGASFDSAIVSTESETYALSGGSGLRTAVIYGTIFGNTTAGNVTLRWAQDTANASDTVVKLGSHLIAERLA